jgi:hypothetical protein
LRVRVILSCEHTAAVRLVNYVNGVRLLQENSSIFVVKIPKYLMVRSISCTICTISSSVW